jgi:hypothetical protein
MVLQFPEFAARLRMTIRDIAIPDARLPLHASRAAGEFHLARPRPPLPRASGSRPADERELRASSARDRVLANAICGVTDFGRRRARRDHAKRILSDDYGSLFPRSSREPPPGGNLILVEQRRTLVLGRTMMHVGGDYHSVAGGDIVASLLNLLSHLRGPLMCLSGEGIRVR